MKRHITSLISLSIMTLMLSCMATSCSSSKKVTEKDSTTLILVDRHSIKNSALYEEATSWLGSPYKYGGQSKNGTDCSGMVVEIFKKVYGIKLYRSSNEIYEKNCKHIKKKHLQEGDLVFFVTSTKGKRINHVGIYLYDDHFIHSSTKRGVIISKLTEPYYERTFVGAGRVEVN